MYYKLVASERKFMEDYQSIFPFKSPFFVHFYQIWRKITRIDEKTG